MAPGIAEIEGTTHGHDVIPVKAALKYFEARGYPPDFAGNILNNIKATAFSYLYVGSTRELGATRVIFGEAVNLVLDKLSKEEAAKMVMVIDSKLCVLCWETNRSLCVKVTSRDLPVSRLFTRSTLKSSFPPEVSLEVSWSSQGC